MPMTWWPHVIPGRPAVATRCSHHSHRERDENKMRSQVHLTDVRNRLVNVNYALGRYKCAHTKALWCEKNQNQYKHAMTDLSEDKLQVCQFSL